MASPRVRARWETPIIVVSLLYGLFLLRNVWRSGHYRGWIIIGAVLFAYFLIGAGTSHLVAWFNGKKYSEFEKDDKKYADLLGVNWVWVLPLALSLLAVSVWHTIRNWPNGPKDL